MKIFGVLLLVLIGIFGITWAFQGNQFFIYRVFAPQYANVQREVFEQTAPYNQGMAQDLRRLEEEYIKADPDHRAALGSLIVSTYASYDFRNLPPDLRNFYFEVKKEQGLR
jgi:hypothetical protein